MVVNTRVPILLCLVYLGTFPSLTQTQGSTCPQNVEAATVSSTAIQVRWDPVVVQGGAQLERYEVQYNQSTFDEIPATNLSSTQGSETRLLLVNLEEYVSYSISVRAHTNEGPGPFSPPVSNTTLEDVPSAPPNNLSVENISASELKVTWKRPNEIDINGILNRYIIRHTYTTQSGLVMVFVNFLPGETLDTTLRNLNAFTTYTVEVAAHTIATGPFAASMGTTSESVPSRPPQNVCGSSNSSTTITVQWESPPENSLNGVLRGYRVRYAPVESIHNPLVFSTIGLIPPDQTYYSIGNLQPFTNYSIEVVAVTIDEGPYSSPIYVVTQEIVLPSVASLVISSATSQSTMYRSVTVEITWDSTEICETNCSYSWNLTYTADQSPPYPEERRQTVSPQSVLLPGNQQEYSISDALPFAEYTVVLFATAVGFGTEGPIDTASQRSSPIAPTVVTNLSVIAVSNQSIEVTWNLPLHPNGPISHYSVYYTASDSVQQPPINSNSYINIRVEDTSVEIIDLDPGISYAIHVQAVGGTEGQGGVLLGDISEEILQQTEETMNPTSGTTQTPTAGGGGKPSTAAIVGGVVAGTVVAVLFIAVTVIIVVVVIARNQTLLELRHHHARRSSEAVALSSLVVTNQLAFDMSECVAYGETSGSREQQQQSESEHLYDYIHSSDATTGDGYEPIHF